MEKTQGTGGVYHFHRFSNKFAVNEKAAADLIQLPLISYR